VPPRLVAAANFVLWAVVSLVVVLGLVTGG
jgi:hypothetical protein